MNGSIYEERTFLKRLALCAPNFVLEVLLALYLTRELFTMLLKMRNQKKLLQITC